MNRHADSIEQLVTEVFAADIRRSVDYYQRLGFRVRRDRGDFVELARRFGSKDSPAFVNGVLDRLRQDQKPAADAS